VLTYVLTLISTSLRRSLGSRKNRYVLGRILEYVAAMLMTTILPGRCAGVMLLVVVHVVEVVGIKKMEKP